MGQSTVGFKSPILKLLASARQGRENWKQRCMQAKKSLKEVKQNLANARESRQRWRNEASQLRQQVKSIQGEIEQLKMRKSR